MMQPLNSMLNWGVANSDPEELKRIADMVHSPAAVTIATAAASPALPSAALWPMLDDRRGAGAGRYSAAKQFRRQRYKHSLPHTLARHALPQHPGVQFKPQRCRSCARARGAPPSAPIAILTQNSVTFAVTKSSDSRRVGSEAR
jgi:hypothetical protein